MNKKTFKDEIETLLLHCEEEDVDDNEIFRRVEELISSKHPKFNYGTLAAGGTVNLPFITNGPSSTGNGTQSIPWIVPNQTFSSDGETYTIT